MIEENPKKLCKFILNFLVFIRKLFDDKFVNSKTTTKTYHRTIQGFKNVTSKLHRTAGNIGLIKKRVAS